MEPHQRDFGASGLSIQNALLIQAEHYPIGDPRRTTVLWNGRYVQTADRMTVPKHGTIRAQFLYSRSDVTQGFDVKVNGWIQLSDGSHVSMLRVWREPELPDVVEHSFFSEDQSLWIWNVYRSMYPGNIAIDEKWTGNAGFWIQEMSEVDRIYHCSYGLSDVPNFDDLIFRVAVTERR